MEGQRLKNLLSAILVLLAAVVIGLALTWWTSSARSETKSLDLYSTVPFDAKLLELDKRALDEAYHDQLKRLFGVWLASQAGDATQITNGLRIARRAYNQAAQQIDKREQELKR